MNRLTTIGKLLSLLLFFAMAAIVLGQETTGSLQGTVKDPSGAVVTNAKVSVTTPSLAGGMSTVTDSKGYYHLSNLPPGLYVVTVDAKGFQTLKRSDLRIEVGHLPTLDLSLSMGSEATVVEVTSATPQIDVTTTTTNTNITGRCGAEHSSWPFLPVGDSVCSGGTQRAPGGHVDIQHRQWQRRNLSG